MSFGTNGNQWVAFAVAVAFAAVSGFAGEQVGRSLNAGWRENLEAAQAAAAERRAVEARLAAARAAAEAARAASEQQQAGPPFSQPAAGGGFNPLAANRGFNPLAPRSVEAPRNDATPLNADYGNLPDDHGVDIVFYTCTACHSAATFRTQHLTAERWDYLLDWMVSDQGMAEPDPTDRDIILAYLINHFGADQ